MEKILLCEINNEHIILVFGWRLVEILAGTLAILMDGYCGLVFSVPPDKCQDST
jgi:hypothetical protein